MITAEELCAIAGAVLSLLFSYVPRLSEWYDALAPTMKRLLMAALLIVVAAAIFGLSCWGVLARVECTQAGALGLVKVLIAALVANQATYLISPKK